MNDVVETSAPERHRWPVLLVVLSLLALGGVGNAYVRHGQQLSLAEQNGDLSVASTSSSATSSAWYCPGALPIGTRTEASSIAIANISSHPVGGELVVADSSGSLTRRSLSVGGNAQVVVGLDRGGASRFASVSVLSSGPGIGVQEMIHGPYGAISSPCVSHSSSTEYLPAGSTSGANNLTLAIYDPGATPAVASVSFTTSTGVATPPAFQGVPVGAGQAVFLNVGHSLPSKAVVATTVTSSGGRVVAGALMTATVGSSLSYSLINGTPRPTSNWLVAAAPSGTSIRQTFSVFNPGSNLAQVVVRLAGAKGPAAISLHVPPGQVTNFAAASNANANALQWASIDTAGQTPVVVSRTTVVFAATSRRQPPTATTALQKAVVIPALAPGSGLTSPALKASERWVLPGGEVDANTNEIVTIANPGTDPITFSLQGLQVPATKGASVFPELINRLTVQPGSSLAVDLGSIVRLAPSLGIIVTASGPVIAGQTLYARGSSSLGFTAAAGIPAD